MPAAGPWGLPSEDLEASLARSADDYCGWAGSRILVTGGTGFLGRWIVASMLHARDRLDLKLHIDILSRKGQPAELAGLPLLEVLPGDVRTFTSARSYDLVIHAAANSSAVIGVGDGAPLAMAQTIVDGTRRVIDVAERSNARMLLLSSGAVYGPQVRPVAESATTAPDPLKSASAYGEAKRMGENFCATATAEGRIDVVIARLFAFVGPGIPLDRHYAAGNFLDDVISRNRITVSGDGRPLRSYLYCGDLSEWCWALITRGGSGRAFNVGSPEAISIFDLAARVVELVDPPAPVDVLLPAAGDTPPCYVPVTDLALNELGLHPRISLEEALQKSYRWYVERA